MAVEVSDMTIVIAGGGTGGHLFPGIAVAEAILARRPGTTILFIGTGRPVETKALAGKPYAYRILATPRLERSLNPLNLFLPIRFAAAIWRAARLLKEYKARLVVGTGGYGSAPVVAAARLRRIPAIILEQNIIPGLTNRLVSRLADLACLAFEPSRALLAPRIRAVVTGNPIRKIVDRNNGRSARTGLGLKPDRFTVFVFGGSQGAKRLVDAAAAALPLLAGDDIQIIVQTGDEVGLEAPAEWEGRLLVKPFFNEIYDCYRAADLVVCRAGGGVAEVLAYGKPMILVPYPYAAHKHQHRNAVYLEQEGAALVVEDDSLDGPVFADMVRSLATDAVKRDRMARASRELGRPDAADQVAREALVLAGGPR